MADWREHIERSNTADMRFTNALVLFLGLLLATPLTSLGQSGNKDPKLDEIGPATVSVGDPDFTLRALGENFDRQSAILLDGVALQTQFVNKKRLQARIPQSLTAATGTHTIAVQTGDGTTTATRALVVGVLGTGVTIDRVNPDAIEKLNTLINVEFRIAGTGFNDKSKVLLYGKAFDTSLREKNVLSVVVPPGVTTVSGFVPIQVKNDNGQLSNLFTLPIYERPASVTALSPASVKVGSAAFQLKIDGNGFSQEAVVRVNNTPLVPTEIKAQLIKVQVPANLVNAEAQVVVYVEQDTGLSNPSILRVTPEEGPFIYQASPVVVQAGARKSTSVEIMGANFAEKSKVVLNGTEVKTTFSSKSRVTFKLSKDQTANPGVTYTVKVKNNDGTESNVVAVAVVTPSVVSTASGENLDGFVDGDITKARYRWPSRMAVGPDGNIYIADQLNHAIRRLDPDSGTVVTLVGDGIPGYIDTGDSTVAGFTNPRFNNPLGIAVAQDGTIYVGDYGNNVIRRIRQSGSTFAVDTVAGLNKLITDKDTRDELKSTRRGQLGYMDGAGSVARFRGPDGLALTSDGVLYVCDPLNQYIRAVSIASGSFDVTTVAGLGISGFADGDNEAARFTLPTDVALGLDESTLYVADFGNNRVRAIDLATGDVSTFAGNGLEGVASGTALFSQYRGPIGVAVASDGSVYVADHQSNTIRVVSPAGVTRTLAGGGSRTNFKDGIGPDANFKDPRGIVFDNRRGRLMVVDQGHQRVREIEP